MKSTFPCLRSSVDGGLQRPEDVRVRLRRDRAHLQRGGQRTAGEGQTDDVQQSLFAGRGGSGCRGRRRRPPHAQPLSPVRSRGSPGRPPRPVVPGDEPAPLDVAFFGSPRPLPEPVPPRDAPRLLAVAFPVSLPRSRQSATPQPPVSRPRPRPTPDGQMTSGRGRRLLVWHDRH